ncbi:hypothetical protein Syun_006990 [Stephania yunnanensis]|uniref:Uncharacterized protein n=1 Tax=Stephania yunnanensis TaxID=152371 RepID=A0AAP0L137_9MAGN
MWIHSSREMIHQLPSQCSWNSPPISTFSATSSSSNRLHTCVISTQAFSQGPREAILIRSLTPHFYNDRIDDPLQSQEKVGWGAENARKGRGVHKMQFHSEVHSLRETGISIHCSIKDNKAIPAYLASMS